MKTVSNVYLWGFVVTLCVVIVDSASHSTYRTRPRYTRGFKNAALSTAIGFGKRDATFPNSQPNFDFQRKEMFGDFRNVLPRTERVPENWFIDQLKENPKFAKLLIKKLMEKNQEDEMSSDELIQNVEY